MDFLKNFCPLQWMFRLKYRSAFRQQKELSCETAQARIFFLDAPSYGNVGDQAIAYAIRVFAAKYFPEYAFIEVLQDDLPQYIQSLKQNVTARDLIFLTGGGNMGNLYRIYEAARRFVIKNFPDNRVFVFPQTIEYTENIFGRFSIAASQRIYGGHKHLTLMAREKFSFAKMQKLYPHNQVVLCPDIVLSLEKKEMNSARTSIGVCLRNDIERALTEQDREKIDSVLNRLDMPMVSITTTAEAGMITQDNRESIVLAKLEEISQCRLFVTDRLHGMIFAALTNTPCIAFENSNPKVRGVYAWIQEIPQVKLVHNIADFDDAVSEFMHMELRSAAETNLSFANVIDAIRKG